MRDGNNGGDPEQMREMLVGALLPAARPHEVEQRRELKQVSGGGGRKEVGYAVDRVEGPIERAIVHSRAGRLPATKQRQDAVDIDHQQWPAVPFGGVDGLFSFHTGRGKYAACHGRCADAGPAE